MHFLLSNKLSTSPKEIINSKLHIQIVRVLILLINSRFQGYKQTKLLNEDYSKNNS